MTPSLLPSDQSIFIPFPSRSLRPAFDRFVSDKRSWRVLQAGAGEIRPEGLQGHKVAYTTIRHQFIHTHARVSENARTHQKNITQRRVHSTRKDWKKIEGEKEAEREEIRKQQMNVYWEEKKRRVAERIYCRCAEVNRLCKPDYPSLIVTPNADPWARLHVQAAGAWESQQRLKVSRQ